MAAILWLPARHRHLHQGGESDKDDADISIWAGRLLKKWKIQITLPESQFYPFNLHSEVSGFPENGLDDHHHNHQHHQHHHRHDLEVVRKTCTQWPFLREPNTSLTPHSLSMHSAQQYKRILCTATDIN